MFELDLLVRMKILIPDELNKHLEDGQPQAYKELEDYLKSCFDYAQTDWRVTKLQIEDAGPYNDAGQWEPSKFHGNQS